MDNALTWRTQHLIGGRMVTGTGLPLIVTNPATEEEFAGLSQPSPGQVEEAIAVARKAFESNAWRDEALRARVLTALADLLEARQSMLRQVLVAETGTPVSIGGFLQVVGPLAMLRDVIARIGSVPDRDLGHHAGPPASRSRIRYQPVGVVAGIGAYNNPLLYLVSKACTAMAAGCTVVYCPSALTPLTTLLFAEIAQEAGVPDGVLNILAGGREVAEALTKHPDVDKVSLTGSVEVGRAVMRQAADTVKGLVLELGGKSAGLVLPGADLAEISLPLHWRYLRNAGQGCQSPTRLLVPRKQFDDFIDVARETYRKVPVGDPLNPATMAGPLISKAHRARVEAHVERAVAAGGSILAGGGRPELNRGWFMNGALIGGLGNDAEIARSELFGPVAMAMPYDSLDAAVAIANDSPFGLAASIFGSTAMALQVAPRLKAGTVSINGGGGFRVDSVLAGWKQSGTGREWGTDGFAEFLDVQHIQWVTE